jgi:hypothetical protein
MISSLGIIGVALTVCLSTLAVTSVPGGHGSSTPKEVTPGSRSSLVQVPKMGNVAQSTQPYQVTVPGATFNLCEGSLYSIPVSILPGTSTDEVSLSESGLPYTVSSSFFPASGSPPFFAAFNLTWPETVSSEGDYTVIVLAGLESTATLMIHVQTCSPFLSVMGVPSVVVGDSPLSLSMDAFAMGGAKSLGNGANLVYLMNYGSYGSVAAGGCQTSASPEFSTSLSSPGVYEFSVEAGLGRQGFPASFHCVNNGYTGSSNVTLLATSVGYIIVGSKPTLPDYSVSPTAGVGPLTVTLSSTCPGTVGWRLPDFSSSNLPNPTTVTIANPGIYPVFSVGPDADLDGCGGGTTQPAVAEIAVGLPVPFQSYLAYSSVSRGNFPLSVTLVGTPLGSSMSCPVDRYQGICEPASTLLNWSIHCPGGTGETVYGSPATVTLEQAPYSPPSQVTCTIGFGFGEPADETAGQTQGLIVSTNYQPVSLLGYSPPIPGWPPWLPWWPPVAGLTVVGGGIHLIRKRKTKAKAASAQTPSTIRVN